MHVAITGATGLIGSALAGSLDADGHTVHRVVRSRQAATGADIYWSVARGEIDAERFAGLDAVVHLAAEPLGSKRWNDEQKARIRSSREQGTRLLSEALASLDQPPPVLVSASAVGFYGDRGEEPLDETSPAGSGFMAEVCGAWEQAAEPAREAGLRVVHPRTGVVIAEQGPLIDKVRVPFKLGVGGRVGSGRQWVPWIAIEDEVRVLRFLIDRDDLVGPVNAVAPQPVRNAELTKALGEAMRRPAVMPVPMLALRLLYGEMGTTLASDSQRVLPAKLLDAGFTWRHPTIRSALRAVFA